MADLPLRFADPDLQSRLGRAVDPEARIARAIAALPAAAGRSVRLLGGDEQGAWTERLASLGLDVRLSGAGGAPARSEVNVALWPNSHRAFDAGLTPHPSGPPSVRDVEDFLARSARDLSEGASLVVVEDYGRDDVSALVGGAERELALVELSGRGGPFLSRGFKLRVLHCWWQWSTLEEAGAFLAAAFGGPGEARMRSMRLPRLAYKVALYHRVHQEDRG